MDTSGNNRYKLLFMDEESGSSPGQGQTVVSKKNESSGSAPVKKSANTAKKNVTEKENKFGTLNKNESVSKKQGVQAKPGTFGSTLNKTRNIENQPHRADFKPKNNEIREQRNVRRNFRDGGEFGHEERGPRQPRERDARGPARNRDGPFRGGKREFDRQSGSDKTGVKAVDKRDGAGAHNWGSVKQEIDDINKSTTDNEVTDKEELTNEQTLEQPPAQEQEEEVRELTLDEWKALRGERTRPQYNIRKPNEGEDTSEWKKMVVLNKKKEGGSEEEYEYDPSMYPQRVGRLQRIVDIQFNFNDGRRGGGGFGRGRGRGPRTGGDTNSTRNEGDRLPKQQRNFGEKQQKFSKPDAPKVDDERQFPTLS